MEWVYPCALAEFLGRQKIQTVGWVAVLLLAIANRHPGSYQLVGHVANEGREDAYELAIRNGGLTVDLMIARKLIECMHFPVSL
jgi:hypothetical protein